MTDVKSFVTSTTGNRFQKVPENIFEKSLKISEIRWEKDECNGSRDIFYKTFFWGKIMAES
jgi:hypothetical protein